MSGTARIPCSFYPAYQRLTLTSSRLTDIRVGVKRKKRCPCLYGVYMGIAVNPLYYYP